MPTLRDTKIYKTFTAEIDLMGLEIFHSPAIQAKFYEAVTSTTFDFIVNLTGFTGNIKLEATTDDTISVESFRFRGKELDSSTLSSTTGSINFSANVADFSYFRISFQKTAGTIDSIEVDAV
jgi:hypothetical protein